MKLQRTVTVKRWLPSPSQKLIVLQKLWDLNTGNSHEVSTFSSPCETVSSATYIRIIWEKEGHTRSDTFCTTFKLHKSQHSFFLTIFLSAATLSCASIAKPVNYIITQILCSRSYLLESVWGSKTFCRSHGKDHNVITETKSVIKIRTLLRILIFQHTLWQEINPILTLYLF